MSAESRAENTQSGQAPTGILIVDDDLPFRAFIATLLTNRGFKVFEARTTREGEQVLAHANPALILVDYRLPDMDGVSWIGKLRGENIETPIIFISGQWCDHRTFNWLRNILKVSLVMQKPIAAEVFMEVIEGLLPAAVKNVMGAGASANFRQECEKLLAEFPTSQMAFSEVENLLALHQPETLLYEKLKNLRNKLELEATIAAARLSYLRELNAVWQELTQTARNYRLNPQDKQFLVDCRGICHKVRGTAGSFDLFHIVNVVNKLEDLLVGVDPRAGETELEILWSEVFRVLGEGDMAIMDGLEQYQSSDSGRAQELRFLAVDGDGVREALSAYESVANLRIVTSKMDALNQLTRMHFDAVLVTEPFASDPDLLAFCRDLRLSAPNPSLPLLLVAGGDIPFTPAEISYAGFSDVLSFQPNTDDLLLTVEELADFSTRTKLRVLVVDDDPHLTDLVARILRLEGYYVQTLNEPIHILEALEECQPEAVILDVIMPGLSGYDVCREIRNQEKWKHVPILFLTAKSNQEGRALAFRAGGDDLIGKPVVREELIGRVRAYAERTRLKVSQVERDQLTNLLTRSAFKVQAEDRLKECLALNVPFTLALISIDTRSSLDPEHTLATMEASLTASLGAIIRGRFEPSVLKARFAERVFALGFPDLSRAQVESLLELLRLEIAEADLGHDTGHGGAVFVTAGLAEVAGSVVALEDLHSAAAQELIQAMKQKLFTRG